MKYIKEIDGLRAIALLPVIFFHAGFSAFSGGFVGVDIFFVISGYLITTIIIDEIDKDSFSLLNFYERRARRILPALFFVMLCTLPFAWLWMTPYDLKNFSQSLVAVSIFVSNIHFWLTSEYFDSPSELKPLLHSWSIAVEEQYYILFPIFLLMIWRFGKKWIILSLTLIAIASLIYAHLQFAHNPSFTFYSLPTRAFEILIGSLISFYANHKKNIISTNQTFSLAGLILVLYAIFTFDKNTPSPSLYSLIPTIGTGLILAYSNNQNLVGKFLSNRLLVGIGLISYSTYLWHYILFAFAKLTIIDSPSFLSLGIIVIISLIFGYFSWKYIEIPFRNKKGIFRNKIFFYSAFGSLFFIVIGLIGYTKNGFEIRLNKEDKAIAAWQNYDSKQTYRRYTCFMEPENTYLEFKNECFGEYSKQAYLIWGDSYAASLSKGLRSIHNDVIQLTASACPPLINTKIKTRPNCFKINEFIKEKIKELKPKKIFLQANWYVYSKENVVDKLYKTIEFIKHESPLTEIIIIGNLPQWEPTLPIFLLRKQLNINQIDYVYMSSYDKLKKADEELINLANNEKIKFISLLDNFCIENKCLVATKYNSTFWLTTFDQGHLTEAGSIYIFTKLKNIIKD